MHHTLILHVEQINIVVECMSHGMQPFYIQDMHMPFDNLIPFS